MDYGCLFQKLIDESDVNTVLTNNLEGKLRTYESLLFRVLFHKDLLLLIFEYIEINHIKSLKLVCKMWKETVEDKRYLSSCLRRKIPKEFSDYKELYDWKMYYNVNQKKYNYKWIVMRDMKPRFIDDGSLEFFCSSKMIHISNFNFYFDKQNKLTFLVCFGDFHMYHIIYGSDHIKRITYHNKNNVNINVSEIVYEKDGIQWEGQVYENPKTYRDIIPHGVGKWKFPDGTKFEGGLVAFCGIPHGIGNNGDRFWLGSRVCDDVERKSIKIPINF